MKKTKARVIFILSLAFIFLLTACDKGTNADNFVPQKYFSLHFTAEKNKKNFEADIICSSYEDIEIKFTAPEELSGFSVKSEGLQYTINAFGVRDVFEENQISQTAPVKILIKAVKQAVFTNEREFIENDNKYTTSILINGVPISMVFNSDGFIDSISAESIGFFSQFSNNS